MKCHKCDQRASIRMRHHRLIFCKDHYIQWFIEQTERVIKKYEMFTRYERVLVAVSGGKDSLALWDVLWQLGYQADGLYINLGIDGDENYSNQSEAFCVQFAQERNLNLKIVNVAQEYGDGIPKLSRRTRRGKEKPCSVCGMIKRHIMNQSTTQSEYPVVATAHNLDDEVSFLMGNLLHWQTDLLARQFPVLDAAPGFARKVKPFCRFSERETAAYTLLREIPYIYDECPFAEGSKQVYYKEMLNKIEDERPGTKLSFYVGFLNARKSGWIRTQTTEDVELHPCQKCGQLTTSSDICLFCRTVNPEKTTREDPIDPSL